MRSTGVKKGTKEQSNAIADQGNHGRSMPAVPVSQKKEAQHEQDTIQQKENKTGLPDDLKSGIENLSGFSMDDTRVHYNSSKPAQLNAFAYAQGTDIQVAPGQEKHLPHEAWHVVQQAQGRVKPTVQMKDNIPVNDDTALEKEADVMGNSANASSAGIGQLKLKDNNINTSGVKIAQLAGTKPNQPSMNGQYRIKLSSPREAFTYNNRAALGLDAVLPGHHKVVDKLPEDGTGKLMAVKIEGNPRWITLAEPIAWPADGQEVLCIDTVAWEDESEKMVEERDKKCVMDVKIGTYTKSTEQFELEGAGFFKRQFKKLEHNLKDLNRDSRDHGYDIDAGNLTTFLNLATAPATSPKLLAAMKAVKPKLTEINQRMRVAPVTFVGSSLFIVYNLTTPAKSDVKLIDPDHPIVIEPGEMQLPDQLIKKKHFAGRWFATWENYVDKWKSSFGSGMISFMRWFSNLSG
jgi:hypothetical protein